MADFYKGYFDDRYSFAHSDKKWYEKHKDAVSKYNHEYYERHKKNVTEALLGNVKDYSGSLPDGEIAKMDDGTIFTIDGKYYVKYTHANKYPQMYSAGTAGKAITFSQNIVGKEGQKLDRLKKADESLERFSHLHNPHKEKDIQNAYNRLWLLTNNEIKTDRDVEKYSEKRYDPRKFETPEQRKENARRMREYQEKQRRARK